VIGPTGGVRVMVATRPMDFREGRMALMACRPGQAADAHRPAHGRGLCVLRRAGGSDQSGSSGMGRSPLGQAEILQLKQRRRS
jgi:hypothetical protein